MAQGIGLQTPIGQRPHRVRLQNPLTPTPDGEGGVVETWADLNPPQLFVRIRPATAVDLERARAGTVVGIATHVITGPYHPDITTETRVIDGDGRTYNVLGRASTDLRRADSEYLVAEAVV
jgi:head-tail adaptor